MSLQVHPIRGCILRCCFAMSAKIRTTLLLAAGIAVIIFLLIYQKPSPVIELPAPGEQEATLAPSLIKLLYGFPEEDFDIEQGKVKSGQYFAGILNKYGLDLRYLNLLAADAKSVFDVRKLKAGNSYTLFFRDDNPTFFVYEINDIEYVVFDFTVDSVYLSQKEVRLERKVASGIIKSSLYKTFEENKLNIHLAAEMGDIFAWVIDFYRLQQGDKFKVIYEEKVIEDKPAGVHRVLGAVFNHSGNDFYAFYFQPDDLDRGNFFDESANSLRKAFLKAPLKFSRISSKFSKNRLHPVLKVNKPHLGVDYAAPHGTPIMSVGDGVVVEATFTKNNGNYVKIRHNSTYSTQYLHMSGFAKGIKAGAKVSQGQVIGYVGSTGLATGPHVCFRFWKNGVQVDPLKIDIPPSEPVPAKYGEEYNTMVTTLKSELDELEF